MRIVVALGGNALVRRGEAQDHVTLGRNAARAAAAVARVAREHEVVVTHGNGPQVGVLAELTETAAPHLGIAPYPLDVLDAATEGIVGYLLEIALADELAGREVASLLTRVEVGGDDPAFGAATKPIGPVYPYQRGEAVGRSRGWTMAPDGGGLRRVVPSPEPAVVHGVAAVRLLVGSGTTVVCAGGGGIPVVRGADGRARGVEAVVDKDLTAAALATAVEADRLVLLTDVDAVYLGWGTAGGGVPVREATVQEMRAEHFAPGSMGPKVAAACRFAASTGGVASIGALQDAEAVVAGAAGTHVVAPPSRP